MTIRKEFLTWEKYGELLQRLNNYLDYSSNSNTFCHYIYGPPKGALPIVTFLGNKRQLKPIMKLEDCIKIDKRQKILIVDDICDTGETMFNISKFLEDHNIHFTTAVLHLKDHSPYIPNYFAERVSSDVWITYPYENVGEKPNRERYANLG